MLSNQLLWGVSRDIEYGRIGVGEMSGPVRFEDNITCAFHERPILLLMLLQLRFSLPAIGDVTHYTDNTLFSLIFIPDKRKSRLRPYGGPVFSHNFQLKRSGSGHMIFQFSEFHNLRYCLFGKLQRRRRH